MIFFLSFSAMYCEGEKSEKIVVLKDFVGVRTSVTIGLSAGVE